MNKNLIGAVLIFLPFFIVTIATSKARDHDPTYSSYTATSDCNNASLTAGTITIETSDLRGPITSPANTTYLSLGLPLSELIIGKESVISAEIAPSLIRTCLYRTEVVETTTHSIYACSDNSIPSCTVILTPL